MIVFVSGEDKVKEARSEYKKSIFVNISDEMKVKDSLEGRQFLPPGDVMASYIDTGDKSVYQIDYCKYLRDPRVHYMLLLLIYQSSMELMFFVNSASEKELLYPKFLKESIIQILENYGIDSKYVVGYKKFDGKKKKFDKGDLNKLSSILENARSKAEEAYRVLS